MTAPYQESDDKIVKALNSSCCWNFGRRRQSAGYLFRVPDVLKIARHFQCRERSSKQQCVPTGAPERTPMCRRALLWAERMFKRPFGTHRTRYSQTRHSSAGLFSVRPSGTLNTHSAGGDGFDTASDSRQFQSHTPSDDREAVVLNVSSVNGQRAVIAGMCMLARYARSWERISS